MNEYIYFDRRFVQSILSQEMRGLTKSLTIQSEAYETSVRGSTTTPIMGYKLSTLASDAYKLDNKWMQKYARS